MSSIQKRATHIYNQEDPLKVSDHEKKRKEKTKKTVRALKHQIQLPKQGALEFTRFLDISM